MTRHLWATVRDLASGLLIALLAGDLLYLYAAGGWTEQQPWLAAELCALVLSVLGGLTLVVKSMSELERA